MVLITSAASINTDCQNIIGSVCINPPVSFFVYNRSHYTTGQCLMPD